MSVIYKVTAIILLGALSKGELPEDEFRIINRQDLLASDSDVFEDNTSKSFSQLLFDVARDQVIVGARDTLYRLSLRGLRELERANWPAPEGKTKLCQDKGQTEDSCRNYIKVLLSYGHKLFACGTNAFSPMCSWREVCIRPYLIYLYNYDFWSRGASPRETGMLRTTQYDLNWLNEPQFVGSFEDDYFVYFVFREVAVEYLNCGKTIYSRIARVCKNDSGGHLVMKDNWSTFLKARLKCPVPGDVPFYYDEVQSVEYLAQEKILVAVFTTPTNSIAGSAVCIYNMSDIQMSFEGQYKVQNSPTSTWEPLTPTREAREHFRCNPDPRPHHSMEYHKYHLMYEAIQPISGEPVYKAILERFTHVTVDVVTTKNIAKQLVVFVATENSDVLKLAILPRYEGACLVEIWKLKDSRGGYNIQNMQFVKDTMSLYIGSDTGVLRLSSERCSRYRSRAGCVGAADPHCGWDDGREQCVKSSQHLRGASFVQSTASCPADNSQVDGGWSSWSEWEPCMQDESTHVVYGDDKPDMCMCRTRSCDNPRPANGGQPCQGASIAVSAHFYRYYPALASIDGSWSPWGPWSACTGAGCGVGGGTRERRRVCGSPAPRHGGADCEGPRFERQSCDLRPCEVRKATAWTPWVQIPSNTSDGSYTEKRFKFLCKAPAPEQIRLSLAREEERYCNPRGVCTSTPPEEDPSFDGWGPWEAWGACSAVCGGGQQQRTRHCRRPPCTGTADMLRPCNTHACLGEWSCWSEWSECSGGCDSTGHRTRTRMCVSPQGCVDAGAALERRACVNTCTESESGWGAWGAWSECEGGERVRRRSCESGACVGAQLQAAKCGDDDMDNELYAMPAYSQNVESASFVTMSSEPLGVGGIVGCVVGAFVMGCLLCLGVVVACYRRPWRSAARVPSSPHYITAKQNSYVTVPLKDVPRKAKRQPSFSGLGNSSGILVKSNNLSNANHNNTMATPKLYPKAIANEYDSMGTLRRHSNQPNNKTNIDIEEDKFY
nr:semaphorin-5B-like [Danaus plexippus plexippus]